MNRFTERRCSQAWHFYGASFRRFAPAEMGDPPQARPLRLSVGSDWPWDARTLSDFCDEHKIGEPRPDFETTPTPPRPGARVTGDGLWVMTALAARIYQGSAEHVIEMFLTWGSGRETPPNR